MNELSRARVGKVILQREEERGFSPPRGVGVAWDWMGVGVEKEFLQLIFVNDEILGCFLKRRVFEELFVVPQQLVVQRGAFLEVVLVGGKDVFMFMSMLLSG